MRKTRFVGARVVTPQGVLPDVSVVIEEGKIIAVEPHDASSAADVQHIDASGMYLVPGFIDLHVHGGGGYDFLSGSAEEIVRGCAAHLRHGTTTILPTLAAASTERYRHALRNLEAARVKAPSLWGVHMEGPYFAPSQAGAQDPESLRMPDPDEYLSLLAAHPIIRRWSVAPELPGAIEMALALAARGVALSIGHSDASFDQAIDACAHGFGCVTHLYSGCSTVHREHAYRKAGVVEAAFYLDALDVEIIADGRHLPDSLIKTIVKIKRPEHVCLVTDALSCAATDAAGEVFDHGLRHTVVVEDGVAKMPDRTCFAGSVATMDRLVRVVVDTGAISLADAIRMASTTPARMLGLTGKGSIAPGQDADLVLLDESLAVRAVYLGGEPVDMG